MESFIEILGVNLEYYFNNINSQKTFVYVHGFNSTFKKFKNLFEKLCVEKGYNFLTFNLPGHGKSKAETKTINFLSYVEISAQVIQTLLPKKAQIVLHGHSMGGGIVLSLNALPKLKPLIKKTIVVAPMNRTSLSKKVSFNRYHIPSSLKEFRKLGNLIYHQSGTYFKNAKISELREDLLLLWSNPERFKQMSKLLKSLSAEINMTTIDQGIKNAKNLFLFFGAEDGLIDVLKITDYFLDLNSKTTVYVRPQMGHTPWQEDQEFYKKWLERNI